MEMGSLRKARSKTKANNNHNNFECQREKRKANEISKTIIEIIIEQFLRIQQIFINTLENFHSLLLPCGQLEVMALKINN